MTAKNIKKGLKERILGNWESTIFGIIIMGASFVAVYLKIATFKEVIGFLTLSGFFIWCKDSIFKLK